MWAAHTETMTLPAHAEGTTAITGARADTGGRGPRWRGSASSRAVFVVAGVVGLLLVALCIGAAGVSLATRGKIYPHVFVNDTDVSGMTQTQAKAVVARSAAPVLARSVTLTNGGTEWTPTFSELGVKADGDGTVAAAYRVGREGGPLAQLWRNLQTRGGAKTYLPLIVSVDRGAMNTYLDTVQAKIGTPPVDATLKFQGDQIAVVPGANGMKLDREKVAGQLLEIVGQLPNVPQPTILALPVTYATPAVTTEQAEQAKGRADALIGTPLALTFKDKSYTLGRDDLVRAVRIGAGPDFAVRLDPATFKPKVDAIAADLKQDPKNAEIGWDNALVVRTSAKDGQRLNVDKTLAQIGAWQGDTRALALPVEIQKPQIPDDVSTLGITTRIGRGVSNFAGSDAARAKNIKIAAGYLDNTVVGPGEIFSFLDAIGEISEARGYQPGYVILAEETVPGIGGGVCQVATTMFRAAIFSGLPIEERNPHAYIVGYYQQGGYPIGLDAAVFSPGVDLKFRNDSDKYMLIKTGVDGAGNLAVSIYGPDLGYKVDVSDPVIANKTMPPDNEYQVDTTLPPGTKKQVEFAKTGEDVAFTRTVLGKDGQQLRQTTFRTHYQAWPNKFLIAKDVVVGKTTDATRSPNNPTAAATKTAPAATTAPAQPAAPATAQPAMPTAIPAQPTKLQATATTAVTAPAATPTTAKTPPTIAPTPAAVATKKP